jgi:hypothetical protein
MDTKPTTPVEYAETTLGVHRVWEEHSELIHTLDGVRKTHVTLVNDVRKLQAQTDEQEFELATALRRDNEYNSQAAFERDLKVIVGRNETMTGLRKEILARRGDVDMLEAEVRNLELQVKATGARISELAALLHFYAECKAAQTEARKVATDPLRNWP